jgi:hypothetical protein
VDNEKKESLNFIHGWFDLRVAVLRNGVRGDYRILGFNQAKPVRADEFDADRCWIRGIRKLPEKKNG